MPLSIFTCAILPSKSSITNVGQNRWKLQIHLPIVPQTFGIFLPKFGHAFTSIIFTLKLEQEQFAPCSQVIIYFLKLQKLQLLEDPNNSINPTAEAWLNSSSV